LAALIEKFADDELLSAVAREHRRGRRLLVQSANMDAQRPVIWDLGAIAASGAPNALTVFRQALLASASLPVAFPPVLIDVEVDGKPYDEMHADGGVISNATALTPWQVDIGKRMADRLGNPRSLTLYVIRNGLVAPEPKTIDYKILGIAGRAVSTLSKSLGVGDLLSAYVAARVRNASYYVTWIGEDFDHEYPGPFDPDYMRALFDYGYALMKSGNAWAEKPPILMGEEERAAFLRLREVRAGEEVVGALR
jgi:hypothetical protein